MSDFFEVNALLYEEQIELLKQELDSDPNLSLEEKEKINERIIFLGTRAEFFREAGAEFRKRFYG